MRPRGWPLQGVDTGCQKGAQAGPNLLEDLRGDLTFLKQLRFSNGISGVHGSAPSGAYIFVSRPQKDFIHNGLDRVNEAKTVEVVRKWGNAHGTKGDTCRRPFDGNVNHTQRWRDGDHRSRADSPAGSPGTAPAIHVADAPLHGGQPAS